MLSRLLLLVFLEISLCAAQDVPVPTQCSADVNAKLAQLIGSPPSAPVDNVMVCGITTRHSQYQPARQHGSHHVFSVLAPFPNGKKELIQVVSNDTLDGVVTALRGARLFAYGQAYFDNTRQFAAGIHDVHCSTHAGADNGWIVVDGVKHPATCPAGRRHRPR